MARDVSSGGLQPARARELLFIIGSASLQFHKTPASFVRRVSNYSYISVVLACERRVGTVQQRSGVKRIATDCCGKRKTGGRGSFPGKERDFLFLQNLKSCFLTHSAPSSVPTGGSLPYKTVRRSVISPFPGHKIIIQCIGVEEVEILL
jgi:hypothetical protein